jgi:lysine 2,3-aminomutase
MPDGTLRTVDGLIAAGLVPEDHRAAVARVASRYAIAVPAAFADLIEDAKDPIGLQVVPDEAELDIAILIALC